MHDHLAFKARIDEVLRAFVEDEVAQLTAISEDLKPFGDQLRLATSHGKRLRSAFCYVGWLASGQPESEAALRAAASMELVHAAALVHDDIIDASRTRRGAPSAHVALRGAIGSVAWQEAGATGLAMLMGNILLSWGGHMFVSSGLPLAFLARTRSLWPVFARELVAGECLEIMRTGEVPLTDQSLEIIRLKTAKYTVERPLHIGATLGGAPDKLLRAFTAYGVPMGEAFQLHDDLLGMFGDPHLTGKGNLDDLKGFKPTALIAVTLAAASGDDRETLLRALGNGHLCLGDLGRIREVMERVGARSRIESMIMERADSARHALAVARLDPATSASLNALMSIAVGHAL
jgi:geranylgeranyl diphosphate synthase, type I